MHRDIENTSYPVMRAVNAKSRKFKAMTLIEILAALAITSLMIIVAVAIYNHGNMVTAAIKRRLEENSLPKEILHMIAEDIDQISLSESNSKLTLEKRLDSGKVINRLTLICQVYGDNSEPVDLKKMVWQSKYDSDSKTIRLYRARSGLELEDPILNTQLKKYTSSELFVPICSDLTYFKITALDNDDEVGYWDKEEFPDAIVVEVSFAKPLENFKGEYEIPQDKLFKRLIAVNRMKDYEFEFVAREKVQEQEDPNSTDEKNDTNDTEDTSDKDNEEADKDSDEVENEIL